MSNCLLVTAIAIAYEKRRAKKEEKKEEIFLLEISQQSIFGC